MNHYSEMMCNLIAMRAAESLVTRETRVTEAAHYEELMKSVNEFKWLEAEKAGRDIWAECCDPDGAAAKAWMRQHFSAWMVARTKRQRSWERLVCLLS